MFNTMVSATILALESELLNILGIRMATVLQFSSVQSLSHVQLFATPWLQHARPPCPLPIPGACSNSCPLSRWCHPTISSSVIPISSCPESFPTSGSFQMSQLFTSGGQNIEVSVSVSILPMNIQNSFLLRWTGCISLQSKGLSRVLFNTTVQTLSFLYSLTLISIHDYGKNHSFDKTDLYWGLCFLICYLSWS